MTDSSKNNDKRKENIARIRAMRVKNTAVREHVHIASKTAMAKVKEAKQTVVTSPTVKNLKKDAAAMGKGYHEITDALSRYAAINMMENDEKTQEGLSAGEALMYADMATALTKAYVRTNYIVTKTGAKIFIKTAKKVKKIYQLKKEVQLMELGSSVKISLVKKNSPKIKSSKPIKHPGRQVANNKLKRSGQAMRRRLPNKRSKAAEPYVAGKNSNRSRSKNRNPYQQVAVEKPQASVVNKQRRIKGKATIYDVSKLEQIYGVHGGQVELTGVHSAGENITGVKERVTEKKPVDHTPKQIKDPSKSERVAKAEKELGIKSKSASDQAVSKENSAKSAKKDKTSKRKETKNRRTKAAKNAVKRYAAKQLLEEGSDDFGAGVLSLAADYIGGKATEVIGKIFTQITSVVKKAAIKLLKWVITGIFTLITNIISIVFSFFAAVFGPMLFIIIVCIVVCLGGIFLIAGFFNTARQTGQFAVEYMEEYTNEVCEEINDKAGQYDEIRFWPPGDQRTNYDDMLLVYLSKIADASNIGDMNGDAPFLWLNKSAEKNTMEEVSETMFTYTQTEEYKQVMVPTLVTCIPTPIPTPIPEPTMAPGQEPTPIPTPDPEETPIPTPTPEPPQYRIEMVPTWMWVDVYNIHMMSAGQYMSGVSSKKVRDNYEILRDLFEELGYREYGGTTICDYYGIDY